MAQQTLLTIVKTILSDMTDDDVSSITDTVRAEQVASIVEETFWNIVDQVDLKGHNRLTSLVASGDTAKPTHMTLPSNTEKVHYVKYDVRTAVANALNYETMDYCEPALFCERVMARDSTASNVLTVAEASLGSGVNLLILTDAQPSFYTSFDDNTLVFDAYDSSLESTLQASKSMCYIQAERTFSKTDAAIPDLPNNLMTLLVQESKALAFDNLKQMANPRAEREARRHRARINRSQKTDYGYDGPEGWGRRGKLQRVSRGN